MVTGQDVADFIGQGDDDTVVALAGQHVQIITAMAQAYTRGNGFDDAHDGHPNDDVAAVIITATARLMANPDQTNYRVGNISYQSHFQGWTLAETFVLNRYRKTAK